MWALRLICCNFLSPVSLFHLSDSFLFRYVKHSTFYLFLTSLNLTFSLAYVYFHTYIFTHLSYFAFQGSVVCNHFLSQVKTSPSFMFSKLPDAYLLRPYFDWNNDVARLSENVVKWCHHRSWRYSVVCFNVGRPRCCSKCVRIPDQWINKSVYWNIKFTAPPWSNPELCCHLKPKIVK